MGFSNSVLTISGKQEYNRGMAEFHFYHPVEVRYGDLDPQGHVNNARYLTYLEQARIAYLVHLGLWDGHSFLDIGVILADVHLVFRSPILFGQKIQVGVRVSRLGNKSFNMDYTVQDAQAGQEHASGSTVLVMYDYRQASTTPITDEWRQAIACFEDGSL
jgi:acyl-CoA thioester hydrolase